MSFSDRIRGIVSGRAAVLASVWRHPLNRGSKLRAVGDYLLWNIVKFTMEAQHVLKLTDELEIIVGRKENYGSAVYAHNISDFHEMLFLAHFLRPDDLFLDVGSNVGMYSVWVTGVTGARSIAFEPVPSTYATLLENIRLNDLGDRITPHQMAAGEKSGSVSMTVSHGGLDHVVTGPTNSTDTVEVALDRVDMVCAGTMPIAMKVDVEGFEMQALQGAAGVLAAPSLKVIVIELQDWTLRKFGTSEGEVRALLRSHGFVPHTYDPETRTLSAASAKSQLNEIFVRNSDEVAARLQEGPRVSFPARPKGV